MTINEELVYAKLEYLKEIIKRIEDMNVNEEVLLNNVDTQDLLDRRMQLAIEFCIDIASHIASSLKLKRGDHASDILRLLGKEGIISGDLSEKIADATGLRNILVHEYAEIDYKLAYSNLDEKLSDLKQFAREVIKLLQEN